MILPGFILGVMVTLWLGFMYYKNDLHSLTSAPHDDLDWLRDFLMPWVLMAVPAFFASLIGFVSWLTRKN